MKYSCKQICQYILLGLLSHFGTLIIIILYLIGGGFLFVLLELENEKSSCFTSYKLLMDKLNDTTYRGVSIGNSGYNASVYYQQMYSMLLNFSQDIFTLGFSPSKDCTTLGQQDNLPAWNLANSIFFCATIITTIGYGNITPSTVWGRIVCIIYAFIGIPLMLLFLGNFGEVLASAFRYVYTNLCCCRCFVKGKYKTISEFESMSKHSAIEVKNFELENEHEESDNRPTQIKQPNNIEALKFELLAENLNSNSMKAVPPPKFIDEDLDIVYVDDENDQDENINIPLTVVTGFLIIYMFLGAVLFQIWETWDLVAAVYFSFITVSTIGFGDLYPAKNTIGSNSATLELIVGAAYCIIGLAILSMCLNLVKEEIVDKFTWLGTKLGIMKSNSGNSDECEEVNDYQTNSRIIIENSDIQNSVRHVNEAYENEEISFKTKIKSA